MKKVVITGGAGTLGSALVERILLEIDDVHVVVFSRDELKHEKLTEYMDRFDYKGELSCICGDVQNREALLKASVGADLMIHAAALKRVGGGERYPKEYIDANIMGTLNVLGTCEANNIPRGVFVSTDKAVSPVNLYGATKLIGEKLWQSYQVHNEEKKFSIVRYGNVVGSNGSVIQKWIKTDSPMVAVDCTRFWIPLKKAVDLVLFAVEHSQGGETFINPNIASSVEDLFKFARPQIKDYAEIHSSDCEKRHEELIQEDEKGQLFTYEEKLILIPDHFNEAMKYWKDKKGTTQFSNSQRKLCSLNWSNIKQAKMEDFSDLLS